MDPAEVRRRNFVPKFTDRYTTGIGTVYDVGDYPEALERVLAAADYDALRAEQARRRAANDPIALGIGHRGVRRDHGRRARQRVRRRRAARRRAHPRAQRFDAVRSGTRHHLGDGGVRAHGCADRAHRGRARRHRPGAARAASPSDRARCRSAARRSTPRPARSSTLLVSAPPMCSSAQSTTSCSTPSARVFHVAGTPAKVVDWGTARGGRR